MNPKDDAEVSAASTEARQRRTWRNALDETYRVGLVLKGIDGLLELIGGFILLTVSPATMDRWAHDVFQHELSEDPNDFIAHHVLHLTGNLHAVQTFGAIYLLSHGAAKLVMVGGLWKHQRWAYPFAIVFLVAFVIYQLYRMTFDPSVGLALLTIFDVVIIWLVWRDFREHQHLDRRTAAAGGTGS